MKISYLLTLSATSMVAIVMTQAAHAQSPNYGGDEWSGAYVGVNGGISTDNDMDIFDGSTITGGASLGYRVQVGSGVVGAEVQGNYSNGQHYETGGGGQIDQYWSGSAKLKAGLGLGSTLVYGTGGYAVANLESGNGAVGDVGWHSGWIFGGGVEQKLTDALSINVEYTQARFDDVTTATNGASFTDDLTNHSIRGGLNYRF
jgi:outer membrane immunogenic protein